MSDPIIYLLCALLVVQGLSMLRLRNENARLRDREILDKVLIYSREQERDTGERSC